jgi:hypothetical protein
LLLTDVVLQDFCNIVGTSAGLHNRVWFRNVFTETTDSERTCADVEAPLITQATECDLISGSVTQAPVAAANTQAPVAAAVTQAPFPADTLAPTARVTKAPTSAGTSAVITSSFAFAVIAFVMMV